MKLDEGGLARVVKRAKDKSQSHATVSAERGDKSKKENKSRSKQLEKDLRGRGYGPKKTTGTYSEKDDKTGEEKKVKERSYFVTSGKKSKRRFKKDMKKVAAKHNQDSVLVKQKGSSTAKLHATRKGGLGKSKSETAGKLKAKKGEFSTQVGKKHMTYEESISAKGEMTREQIREGVLNQLKKGTKRHKDAVEKKKIKNRKAVPYAALAAEHQPEGEMVEELSRRSKPSAKAKMAKLDAILQRREDRKVKEKEALKTEGWLGKKKKEEKKPEKAMDAGARLRRKKQRQEYADKVSGSVDNVPDDIRDHVEHMDEGVGRALGNAAKGAAGYAAQVAKGAIGSAVKGLNDPDHKPNAAEWTKNKPSSSSSSTGGASAAKTQADKANKARVDARKKAIKKIKDDRRERATNIMTAEKAAKKVKKEGEDKKFKADSEKPIVAEFVDHLWEAKKKCSKCGKVYTGKSCSCCAK